MITDPNRLLPAPIKYIMGIDTAKKLTKDLNVLIVFSLDKGAMSVIKEVSTVNEKEFKKEINKIITHYNNIKTLE